MTLITRGIFPKNVFELLGRDENSASFALGWAVENSPAFAKRLIEKVAGSPVGNTGEAHFHLQTHGEDRGYTDIEIRCGAEFEAILEAKVGWQVPTERQLRKYRPRLAAQGARIQKLVSVSAASVRVARAELPKAIDGAEVVHLSWGAIRSLARLAHADASGFEEKLWLRQFTSHMESYAAMNRIRDNLVFVVPLGAGPMVSGGQHTWIDVVEQDGCYFHPVGRRYPKQPVNYIGFRYRGILQSIHRVTGFEIITDVSQRNPFWLKTDVDHFVYTLGPGMRPPQELRTGPAIVKGAHVWCAIDTLLTGEFDTLGKARDETRRRLQEAEDAED